VYYTPDGGIDFYWVSRPDSRHSSNLTDRPEVAIVIYDSHLPVFNAEAVYLTAHAEQVPAADLALCTEIYRSRLPDLTTFTPDHLQAPNPLRLYRARSLEASVLLNDDGPDLRVPLDLPL
jgi:hypothetical protein